MTSTLFNPITISELDRYGHRCLCYICGGVIEKFEVHGIIKFDDSDNFSCACLHCLTLSADDIAARLRLQAHSLRRRADEFDTDANRTWQMPDHSTVEAFQAEMDAADAEQAAHFAES